VEVAEELLARPSGDFEVGVDPATGYKIIAKDGRYGPYVTEVLPDDAPKTGKNAVKPRIASLFKTMSVDSVNLETALKLLALPRVVGKDPESGEEITAQNGRYGPVPEEGHGLALALQRGSDLRRHAGRGAGRSTRSPSSSAGAARPSRRCASSARTRRTASRWWPRRAASARTSPTARRT
jgi:hypothetical protein